MNRLKSIWDFLSKPQVYWRLFSLLLAITFWLLATGDFTFTETERVIVLEVAAQNLPADFVLLSPAETVRVRIKGYAPILNRGEDAIFAHIDLAEAAEGSQMHEVEVQVPFGIEILSITPDRISVDLERREAKEE